jgi:hypothetical protein
VLKNAGIVQDEKRGTQVYYHLRCPCVLSFIEGVEEVIQKNAPGRYRYAMPILHQSRFFQKNDT